MARLFVNIDHVATIREARKGDEPDPIAAAVLAEIGGASGITLHLREDRRHVQDHDLHRLMSTTHLPVNLEMACTDEMVSIAIAARPHRVTLVPERRAEVTTEGGLDVVGNLARIQAATAAMRAAGIGVSLFIDPAAPQLDASREAGADYVELHTGRYALAKDLGARRAELDTLIAATNHGLAHGQVVSAGHGLDRRNVQAIAAIPGMGDLHIGHSVVSHAVLVGFERAVRELRQAILIGLEWASRGLSPAEVLTRS